MKRIIVNQRNVNVITFAIITLVLMVTGACTKTGKSTTTTAFSTTTTSTTPAITALTLSINTKAGIGTYLVDGNGHTLYWTTLDSVGQSNIIGAVLANWPIFYNANIVVPSSLNASDFGSITRADGNMQTTFKGRPIYYYINDQASGSTLGQGINGVWFAVDPTISGPTQATTTTTTTPTTTTYPGY
jgi:predicted lipoprotein with Yx(FWY)xxD motif